MRSDDSGSFKRGCKSFKTYNITLAFVESRLLHRFECVFGVLVSFARAKMHFGEVTVSKQSANDELLLEVQQDYEPFHTVDPVVALCA